MKRKVKKFIKILLVLMLALGIYAGYLFGTYYRLPDNLTLEVNRLGENSFFDDDFKLEEDRAYMIMTYNIGFGAYRKDFSFFMDGGKSSWAKDEESVIAAVCSMAKIINDVSPDFVFLQEVDVDGTRSHHVDELELMNQFMKGYYYSFAQNYDSPFMLFPLWQPHGANQSGIATYSRAQISHAMRRSLPISETVSKMMDLDRCYSVSRIPTENDKELCLYNVHLSIYGSNDTIREAQLSMLFQDMAADYKAGNYVICGGDFNHNLRREQEEDAPQWAAPFPRESLPEGFSLGIDEIRAPEDVENNTCRNADAPYDPETSYTVTLDGFIISDNVDVNYYHHMDWDHEYSDHEPVILQFFLR